MTFSGFPQGFRSIPVPNQLFGPLLASIQDVTELKCTLRAIWLIHHKKGYPRFISLGELTSDRVLVSGLQGYTDQPSVAIATAVDSAVTRGSLLCVTSNNANVRQQMYFLNTEPNRNFIHKLNGDIIEPCDTDQVADPGVSNPPNIFSLYEQNVGIITPLMVDVLIEAEERYPQTWIHEAFKLAVESNGRNWRYISRILDRWTTEGKADGKSWGHPKKSDRERYLKEYIRKRGSYPTH